MDRRDGRLVGYVTGGAAPEAVRAGLARTLSEQAADYVHHLRRIQPHGPYFGAARRGTAPRRHLQDRVGVVLTAPSDAVVRWL